MRERGYNLQRVFNLQVPNNCCFIFNLKWTVLYFLRIPFSQSLPFDLFSPLFLLTSSTFPGHPEAGVPLQPHELPAVQRGPVLLQAGVGAGAEGPELTAGHRQHPHVPLPAGPLPRPGAPPCLLHRLHQQRHQSVLGCTLLTHTYTNTHERPHLLRPKFKALHSVL